MSFRVDPMFLLASNLSCMTASQGYARTDRNLSAGRTQTDSVCLLL